MELKTKQHKLYRLYLCFVVVVIIFILISSSIFLGPTILKAIQDKPTSNSNIIEDNVNPPNLQQPSDSKNNNEPKNQNKNVSSSSQSTNSYTSQGSENTQSNTEEDVDSIDWAVDMINARSAWSESTGSKVKIAVLDSGIGPVNGIKVNEGYNCVNDNTDTTDRNGHGTMVASIIAADHSTGILGIAPDAEIYPVKVMNDTGYVKLEWAIAGVRWAINKQVQIISISWYVYDNARNDLKQILDEAYYDKGILIVAAAGNNGYVECPAKYDSTIAVAAIDQKGYRLSLSAIGSKIELSAPGENIVGLFLNNAYGNGSGTSFAAPYVTGTAALIWEKNNTLTNTQVRDILCQTATDRGAIGKDTLYGWGIVNVTAAIQMASGNLVNNPNTVLQISMTLPYQIQTSIHYQSHHNYLALQLYQSQFFQ